MIALHCCLPISILHFFMRGVVLGLCVLLRCSASRNMFWQFSLLGCCFYLNNAFGYFASGLQFVLRALCCWSSIYVKLFFIFQVWACNWHAYFLVHGMFFLDCMFFLFMACSFLIACFFCCVFFCEVVFCYFLGLGVMRSFIDKRLSHGYVCVSVCV